MNLSGKITELKDAVFHHHPAPRTWVLTADERQAKIFRRHGERLEFIGEALPTSPGAPDDLTHESVGHIAGSTDFVHHKLESHAAAGEHEHVLFARQIGNWLEAAVREDAFDRIIIAAPPRMLGLLRKSVNRKVRARTIAELDKNLTPLPEEKLREELADIILW